MLVLVTVVTLALDLATKAVAASQLHLALPVSLIDGYLRFTLVNNTGTAFGLFPGRRVLFLIFSCIAIVAIIVLFARLGRATRLQVLAMGLLLGGALGNLHDRVRFGPVTDFIEMGIAGHYWPVFNIADAAITIGVVLLAWTMLRHDRSVEVEATD
jgi:signal peptidase II